jgi:nitric oxide reductase NorQ protein
MTVHVEPKVQRKLEAAYAGFLRGERTVVALRGPSGAGKTITAEWLAQKHDLPFWKVDVAALRDFSDWVGSMSLRPGPNGDVITEFVPSQFAEAIASDGPYGGIPRIVLLDDATRAETAGAMNALIPTLDGRGSIYVPDARKSIAIDPAVFFIATMNIGSGFTGAVTMDAAVANRATGWLEVSYPSNTVEATILVEQTGVDRPSATKLVAVALQVRAMAQRGEIETGVSTRQLVATAHHVVSGLNLVEACEFGFGESYSPDGEASSERTKVLSAINAVLR